jgi:UDP-glucose 4-epimerase
MNMTIITGSNGYIGSRLVESWQATGRAYWAVDRSYTVTADSNLALDLTQREATLGMLQEIKPDVLIHAGTHSALAYRDSLVQPFDEDYRALQHLVSDLPAACRVVYFSSTYVYSGLPTTGNVTEETPLLPRHNFGVAKAFFEQWLLRTHPNSIVFRLSSVFGRGQALHPNAITHMIRECQDHQRVTVWGEGQRRMQYVYIDDVVQAVEAGLQLPPGIYNLGGAEHVTVREVAQQIAERLNGTVIYRREKPEGESLPRMSIERLKQSGVQFTPLTTALATYISALQPAKAEVSVKEVSA